MVIILSFRFYLSSGIVYQLEHFDSFVFAGGDQGAGGSVQEDAVY